MFSRNEVFVLLSLLSAIQAVSLKNVTKNETLKSLRKFPDDFFFGTATSSYQIEGAWNEGGKGWSMWDHLVRTDPGHIRDGTNGDVAANSYHFYEKDIAILKELGVSVYRFSVSWPRILPFGRADYVNPEGIAYYNKLIDLLLANNITPFLTMYHWELPQNLNEQGGWLTEDIMYWFGDYSRVLYQHFGDRVKLWLTINEPSVHCNLGYGSGNHAPRIRSPGIKYYECGRNILLAHARAYHIYNNEFRHQGGRVGLALDSEMSMPSSSSPDDIQAAEDYLHFFIL
ncbi:myrosinase 1-like [Zerene cesonia]|uniref:myrosinase 1-like n=1 Tax=Zerene cesonia TaxID=33412 RepID=UPI0018E51893|nr:myrosinase 1-like [Zerene cesonia]